MRLYQYLFSKLQVIYFFSPESMEDPSTALTDEEYRVALGKDYVFFEITEPEQLAYTYKVGILET